MVITDQAGLLGEDRGMMRSAVCAIRSSWDGPRWSHAPKARLRSAAFAPARPEPTPAESLRRRCRRRKVSRTKVREQSARGGDGARAAATDQAITTEIYAEQADFDSKEYIGKFSGHVIVKDPRFNIQADKLTVYLGTGGTKRGLEKARSRKATSAVCAMRPARRRAAGANSGPGRARGLHCEGRKC